MANLNLGLTTVLTDTGGTVTQTFPGPNHTFTIKAVNQAITGTTNSTKDNATSDQLAIYNGSTKLWGINESGFTQNLNKPLFAANWNYVGIQLDNEFLNSDGSKNGWTAHSNPQGDFNATEGIYTAPIEGYYFFAFHDNMYRTSAGHFYMDWYKNDILVPYARFYGYVPGAYWENFSGHLTILLYPGDTIRLRVHGSVRLDGNNYGIFHGHLLT